MMSEEAPIRIVDCESDDEKGNHTDINSEDLKTIDDNNWLNDKVMLKYLSLLQSEVAKCTKKKIRVLNSFFSEKLLSTGYEGVKGYFKKTRLLDSDILLVLFNDKGVHWTFMWVDLMKKEPIGKCCFVKLHLRSI